MTYSKQGKTRILFLCTGNSCRSQMAEGLANAIHGDILEAHSAGIERHGMNPQAVQVMNEAGIDMSAHRSKTIDVVDLQSFDFIITVCDHAHESCPVVPEGCRVIHQGFDDPPRLAGNLQDKEEILTCYRRVRDEIKNYIRKLPEQVLKERKDP